MHPSFQGTAFPPDGRGGGRACQVVLEPLALSVTTSDGTRAEWPYRELKFDRAGEEDAYLLLSCPTRPGPLGSVTVGDPSFVEALAHKAPHDSLSGFRRNHRGHVLRKWRNLVLAGILSVGGFFGGYWLLNDWIADWAAKKLPVKTEIEWGEVLVKSQLMGMKELTKGPAYDAARTMMRRLRSALPKDVEYPLVLHVVDDPLVNAFALPGGHMVLMTGLMREARSPEEVAGVLAHEVQHVLQRHVVKRAVRALGWRIWFSLFFGGSGIEEVAFGAGSLMEMTYGRAQESEADRKGAELLAKAGLPIGPLGDFFDRLSQKDASDRIPAFLSTHPASKERSEELKRLARELDPKKLRPLPVDWKRVKKELE